MPENTLTDEMLERLCESLKAEAAERSKEKEKLADIIARLRRI
jgi:hypothetical protein